MSNADALYEQGRAAHIRGLPLSANPHPEDMRGHEWASGWNYEAETARRRAAYRSEADASASESVGNVRQDWLDRQRREEDARYAQSVNPNPLAHRYW